MRPYFRYGIDKEKETKLRLPLLLPDLIIRRDGNARPNLTETHAPDNRFRVRFINLPKSRKRKIWKCRHLFVVKPINFWGGELV